MRKRLTNHTPRGTTLGRPLPAILFGVVFLGLGMLVVAIGMEWIEVDESSVHAPRWVLTTVGAVFGLPGLVLLLAGLRRFRRLSRRKRVLADQPDRPWHADHAWSPRGEVATGARPFFLALSRTLFFGVFLVPFNWWAWISGEGGVMVKVIVGLFDAGLVLSVLHAGLLFLRLLRYGKSELVYDEFPFFAGGEVSLRFRRPGTAAFHRLPLSLRCVEEVVETTGS
ncbi:MAG: hypothetical protein ACYTDY_06335, partial [Planctomycetota bacterium]